MRQLLINPQARSFWPEVSETRKKNGFLIKIILQENIFLIIVVVAWEQK